MPPGLAGTPPTGGPCWAVCWAPPGRTGASRGRGGSPEVDARGRITYFEEKSEEPRSTLSGIALYFYPRDTLPLVHEYLAGGNNPDQPGRLIQWLYPRVDVYTWHVPGQWYDIGDRTQLEEADRVFSQS